MIILKEKPFLDITPARVNVRVAKFDLRTGRVREVVHRHNLAVLAGRNMIRDLLNGDTVAALSHFAVGTGTTAPASTDTTLGTEVFRDVFTKVTEADAKLTIQYFLGSQSANGNDLSEAGLFNDDTTGTMYARVTFPADAKTASEAWTFNWELTWGV